TSGTSLGAELGGQVEANAGPLRLASYIAIGLSAVMPTLPFLALGIGLLLLSRRLSRPKKVATPAATQPAAPPPPPATTPVEPFLTDSLPPPRTALKSAAAPAPLATPRRGPGLLDRIGGLRKDLAKSSGLWVPAVRVRDNIQLDPQAYRILIGGR